MAISIVRYVFQYLLLLFLQVFIVGKLNIDTLVQPNILLLFFLTLPVNLKPLPGLLIAFAGGMVLDMFNNSAGFNSTAFLIMMFSRVYYIRAFAHIDVIESGVAPGLNTLGFRWFIVYATIMVSVFHLIYSFIETFSFFYIPQNLLSTILSGAVSLGLILLFQLLFYRTRKSE